MNFKAIAAGALATLMAGSTLAFATDLGNYPAPFVDGSTVNALFVVGAAAMTDDVAGAINMAARLGGAPVTTEQVTTAGVAGTLTISGEGREVGTVPTPIFLGDNLGKSGLRVTLTNDDLPTVLAKGTLNDADASTTHTYKQYIDMTPVGTAANYRLEFNRPGSTSTLDAQYNFGRFTTSPSSTEYAYRTRIVFATNVNTSTAVGEKLTLFGGEYTIASGTTAALADTTADKFILFGGSETHVLTGGESLTVTLDGTAYTVTLVGDTSSTVSVVKVGSDQRSITKSTSTKVGGLDVYVDDVYYLSTTDQTQNSAKLLLGAKKITLQDGAKVKLGDNEDPVDGTQVDLVTSAGKLSQVTVFGGGRTSTTDYIAEGINYADPLWKNFGINFVAMVPTLTDATRNIMKLSGSGDNLLQMTWKDDKSSLSTFTWAYKASSTGTVFNLADNGGDPIHVLEGEIVKRDDYIILDAGDFPKFFEVTGVTLDSSSSAGIDLRDVLSGQTVKITTSGDNNESAVIEGQTYNFYNASSTTFTVTWGNGSAVAGNAVTANNSLGIGSHLTIWPYLKGKAGEHVAFITDNVTVNVTNVGVNNIIQFPTGAIRLAWTVDGAGGNLSATAVINEDSTGSACQTTTCFTIVANAGNVTGNPNSPGTGSTSFVLGRTSTNGINYTVRHIGGNKTVFSVTHGSQAQPGFILNEEKDDAGNENNVIVRANYEASGSNNVAIPGQPAYTDATSTAGSETSRGSDSNILEAVDIYGTYHIRRTSGQDTMDISYPDDQAIAKIAVLKKDSTASVGAGGTVSTQKITPIKTSVAKLDTEVTEADKNTKNLILVGGPAVNTLVADLGAAGKTWTRDKYVDAGEGTAIIQWIADAFASGQGALIVAGHSAADTRAATTIMQNYDSHTTELTGKTGVLVENEVITGELTV